MSDTGNGGAKAPSTPDPKTEKLEALNAEMLALLERLERDLTAVGASGEPLKSIRALIVKAKGGGS